MVWPPPKAEGGGGRRRDSPTPTPQEGGGILPHPHHRGRRDHSHTLLGDLLCSNSGSSIVSVALRLTSYFLFVPPSITSLRIRRMAKNTEVRIIRWETKKAKLTKKLAKCNNHLRKLKKKLQGEEGSSSSSSPSVSSASPLLQFGRFRCGGSGGSGGCGCFVVAAGTVR